MKGACFAGTIGTDQTENQKSANVEGVVMLTPRQAAERVGVSLSLVYQWVESRQLPHYRAGAKGKRGKILIAEADLNAFWESLKVAAATCEKKMPPPPMPQVKLKHVIV